jgi:osmotically-inducible protein OsmY
MTLTRGRAKTDQEIQLDILAEIARDFRFKPAELGVEVDGGIVTLTGTVSSFRKIGEAAEIATGVPGVRDVANKLTVNPAGTFRDDTAIARAVRNALEWDAVVPDDRIDSIVRHGVVTLTGTVGYGFQRTLAADAIANLNGVVFVNNHIRIVPPVRSDADIYDELTAALRRRFPSESLDAIVDAGTVTLMGAVPSYRIRREAEGVTWATHGVLGLTNNIVIA